MTNETQIDVDPALPYIDTIREFDADTAAVYRAHVEPRLLEQWMGPASATFEVVEYDVRPGGKWRYQGRSSDGEFAFGFSGIFHSAEPDKLLIQTFEYDAAPGIVGVATVTFEELPGGRTRMTAHEVYPSVEVRDMAFSSGMEYGLIEGYKRLDTLLAV